MLIKKILNPKIIKIIFFKLYCKFSSIKAKVKYFFLPKKIKNKFINRINIVLKNQKISDYKKICIFVSFSNTLSESSKSYLKTIYEAGYGVIFVNNKKISEIDFKFLKQHTIYAINRLNIGRDIGAYKDIFLFLNYKKIINNINYLCFANDSIQFIPGKNAKALKSSISNFEKSDSDGLFTNYSYQVEKHYQSYFCIIKKRIFNSNEYLLFWQNYKPYDDKQHNIINGEIALSRRFYNQIDNPTVLYSSIKLGKLFSDIKSFNFDNKILSLKLASILPSTSSVLLSKFNLEVEKIHKNDWNIGDLINDFETQLLIFNLIENSNPTHIGAFVFPLFLKSPFLKKDLALSGCFNIAQSFLLYELILLNSLDLNYEGNKDLYLNLTREFELLLEKKGNPFSYKNKKFDYFELGLT